MPGAAGCPLQVGTFYFASANSVRKETELNYNGEPLASATHGLIALQEQERKQIASELHDSVGQSLILIKNKIHKMRNNQPDAGELDSLSEIITNTIQDVRNISYELRPYELDLFGLTHAINSLTEQVAEANQWELALPSGIINNVFTKEHEIYIYRIWQDSLRILTQWVKPTEAKLTVLRHRKAVEWKLELTNRESASLLAVSELKNNAFMLRLLEHLKIVGGTIAIKEEISQVTTIQLLIPTLHEKA